ncbi:hypothetical protein ABEQ49_08085 [Cutibacterium acnes]
MESKSALAKATAELIEPGESVFIDNGTTALAVAEELSGKNLTAMTVSLHSAAALASKQASQETKSLSLVDPSTMTTWPSPAPAPPKQSLP